MFWNAFSFADLVALEWINNLAETPHQKGTYVLWMAAEHPIKLKIGALGEVFFAQGDVFYFGSALGTGGLFSRIKHHLHIQAKPHWHIDWLRPHILIKGWLVQVGTERLECLWCKRVLQMPGSCIPVAGFGSSDCQAQCPAHLLGFY